MKRTKTQNGITLIALIITILVLLILAVVAIGALQNTGIITHAQNSKTQYSKAQVEEEVKIALSEWEILQHTKGQDLGDFLKSKYDDVTTGPEEGSYIVTLNGYEVTIAKDGDISEIQIAGPKPVVSNIKIVDSEGDEVPEKSITEEDTTIYIQFNTSIEEGTIESVKIGETVISPTEGIYSYGVIENGEYVFSITGKIGEERYTTNKKITVNQFKVVPKIGAYVKYDVSYKDIYSLNEYGELNGWRYLGESDNGEKLLISTGIPMALYLYIRDSLVYPSSDMRDKWWDSDTTKAENVRMTNGLLNNLKNIPYKKVEEGESSPSNTNSAVGLFEETNVTVSGETYTAVGSPFLSAKYSNKVENIRTLTKEELENAADIAGCVSGKIKELEGVALGLFDMKDLESYEASYSYITGTPYSSGANVYYVDCDYSDYVTTGRSLTSKENGVDRI